MLSAHPTISPISVGPWNTEKNSKTLYSDYTNRKENQQMESLTSFQIFPLFLFTKTEITGDFYSLAFGSS